MQELRNVLEDTTTAIHANAFRVNVRRATVKFNLRVCYHIRAQWHVEEKLALYSIKIFNANLLEKYGYSVCMSLGGTSRDILLVK